MDQTNTGGSNAANAGQVAENGERKFLKIALIAFGHIEHIGTMVNYASILKEAGHEVNVITNGNAEMVKAGKKFKKQHGITLSYTDDKYDLEEQLSHQKGMFAD